MSKDKQMEALAEVAHRLSQFGITLEAEPVGESLVTTVQDSEVYTGDWDKVEKRTLDAWKKDSTSKTPIWDFVIGAIKWDAQKKQFVDVPEKGSLGDVTPTPSGPTSPSIFTGTGNTVSNPNGPDLRQQHEGRQVCGAVNGGSNFIQNDCKYFKPSSNRMRDHRPVCVYDKLDGWGCDKCLDSQGKELN